MQEITLCPRQTVPPVWNLWSRGAALSSMGGRASLNPELGSEADHSGMAQLLICSTSPSQGSLRSWRHTWLSGRWALLDLVLCHLLANHCLLTDSPFEILRALGQPFQPLLSNRSGQGLPGEAGVVVREWGGDSQGTQSFLGGGRSLKCSEVDCDDGYTTMWTY